ncbi:hypothetical protein A2U01_0092629, partial [Trifolium medium]|nr:hypothetical protein [Trifolium medium]
MSIIPTFLSGFVSKRIEFLEFEVLAQRAVASSGEQKQNFWVFQEHQREVAIGSLSENQRDSATIG